MRFDLPFVFDAMRFDSVFVFAISVASMIYLLFSYKKKYKMVLTYTYSPQGFEETDRQYFTCCHLLHITVDCPIGILSISIIIADSRSLNRRSPGWVVVHTSFTCACVYVGVHMPFT